jgi:excisionase family DNA binding protein
MQPTTDPLPDDAITTAAAARLLHVAPCTLWRWAVRDGRLRAWRVGKRWRFSRAEVLALVRHNEPRPEVQARAERAKELAEVDAVLRAAGVRR